MSEQFSSDHSVNSNGNPGVQEDQGQLSKDATFSKQAKQMVLSPADAILQELKDGNERFVRGESIRKPASRDERKMLENGQKPDVICICCADSRVDPSDAFDMGTGRIFEVENAGEIVIEPQNSKGSGSMLKRILGIRNEAPTSTAIGTIEYMVSAMVAEDSTGVLLVLGHTHCGAVQSALEVPAGTSAGSPHLDALLQAVRNHLPQEVQDNPGEALEHAVAANAQGVVNDILEHSALVRKAVASGHLVIAQATYHLDTGKVGFLGS